jgi:phosphoglycerate kinase
VGDAAKSAVAGLPAGGVVLLENLRFHPEEEKDDEAFAKQLASLTDLYVNDAFGAAHRAHASVHAITREVPNAAAGLLMEKELEYLGRVLASPDRPLVAILGGAKVSDKLEVIQNFLGRVDRLIIGGAMAYTFLKSRGVPVGRSLVEDDKLDLVRDIEAKAKARGLQLGLPVDHVVADKLEAGVPSETLDVGDAKIGERMGLDIGPKTIALYAGMIKDAKTVVWNGPMGVFEIPDFAKGTNAVATAVADVNGTTIVGGGDSIAAVNQAGIGDRITHISTGGGASLEFLGGRQLPGVEALSDK